MFAEVFCLGSRRIKLNSIDRSVLTKPFRVGRRSLTLDQTCFSSAGYEEYNRLPIKVHPQSDRSSDS